MVMNEKSEGSKIWQVVAGLWLSWLGHTEVYLLLVEISFMGRGGYDHLQPPKWYKFKRVGCGPVVGPMI